MCFLMWGISHGHDDRRMSKKSLYEIGAVRNLQALNSRALSPVQRAGTVPVPCDKIIKIRNPSPRGRLPIGIDIIPAQVGGKIHNACARIQTLRGEVGTVPPSLFIIVIGRVAAKGPFMGIAQGLPFDRMG